MRNELQGRTITDCTLCDRLMILAKMKPQRIERNHRIVTTLYNFVDTNSSGSPPLTRQFCMRPTLQGIYVIW